MSNSYNSWMLHLLEWRWGTRVLSSWSKRGWGAYISVYGIGSLHILRDTNTAVHFTETYALIQMSFSGRERLLYFIYHIEESGYLQSRPFISWTKSETIMKPNIWRSDRGLLTTCQTIGHHSSPKGQLVSTVPRCLPITKRQVDDYKHAPFCFSLTDPNSKIAKLKILS